MWLKKIVFIQTIKKINFHKGRNAFIKADFQTKEK